MRGSLRTGSLLFIATRVLATLARGAPGAAQVPIPQARELAPGAWLIPGGMAPDREPDGNTLIFDAPEGL